MSMSIWIHIDMDGDDHGNVPVFSRDDGTWCFSDGPYSTYEFFARVYDYPPEADDDDSDVMPIGMEEFQDKLFKSCSAVAEGIECRFIVLGHEFTLTHVYCDNYGNEI